MTSSFTSYATDSHTDRQISDRQETKRNTYDQVWVWPVLLGPSLLQLCPKFLLEAWLTPAAVTMLAAATAMAPEGPTD